jgi:hypothetical protein
MTQHNERDTPHQISPIRCTSSSQMTRSNKLKIETQISLDKTSYLFM